MKKVKLERSPELQELQLTAGSQQQPPQTQARELNLESNQQTGGTANSTSNNQTGQNIQNNNQNSGSTQQQPPNFCNICNKELCNKYFMKTHMQKMHGINLGEGGSGVMCDICQKMLCSKYFLKVHKSNTHGVTDYSGQHSAGSQAAIALANTLTNAQKCAALNLALNQHQLQQQSRQAAALMNAATFTPPLQLAAPATGRQQQQQQMPISQASPLVGSNNGRARVHQATSGCTPPARSSSTDGLEEEECEEDETGSGRTTGALEASQQAAGELQNRQAILQAVARNPAAAAMLACAAAAGQQPTSNSINNNGSTFNPLAHLQPLVAQVQQQQQQSQPPPPPAFQQSNPAGQQQQQVGNNNRYLRHYTEACNICDRRFKSIKWLQSHVMNDHKNEIENLFNVLIQLLICGANQQTTASGQSDASHQNLVANNETNLINSNGLGAGTNPLVQQQQQAILGAVNYQSMCNSPNGLAASAPNSNFAGAALSASLFGQLFANAPPLPPLANNHHQQQHLQQQQHHQQPQQQSPLQPQPQQQQQAMGQFVASQVAPAGDGPGPLESAAGLTGTLASLISLQQQLRVLAGQQQQHQLPQPPPPVATTTTTTTTSNQRRRLTGGARAARTSAARQLQARQQQQPPLPPLNLFDISLVQQQQVQEQFRHFQRQQQQQQQFQDQEQPLSLTTTPTSQSPQQSGAGLNSDEESEEEPEEVEDEDSRRGLMSPGEQLNGSIKSLVEAATRGRRHSSSCEPADSATPSPPRAQVSAHNECPQQQQQQLSAHQHIGLLFESHLARDH